MGKLITRISTITFVIVLILLSLNCRNSDSGVNQAVNANKLISPTPKEVVSSKSAEAPEFVDVPRLANESSAEFDKVFGEAVQITEIRDNPAMMPGEYRLYKVKGHPKGLSVRFFKDKARRFNLLLGEPQKSSKEALSAYFRISVGEVSPDTLSDPLSEKWKGEFGNVNFATLYAKREKVSGDFTMIHAEIAR